MTEGTCNAGLVAVTVTPGRTAPVLSVTTPADPGGICGALAGHRGRRQRKQALNMNEPTISAGIPGERRSTSTYAPPQSPRCRSIFPIRAALTRRAMYEERGGERICRAADYDAGMEHTLNPQEITVNSKSRECHGKGDGGGTLEGDPERWTRRLEVARPSGNHPNVNRRDQKLNVAPICRILGNRIVAGRR